MSRSTSAIISMLAVLLATPVVATVDDHPGQTANEAAVSRHWDVIDDLRVATAGYHDVSAAVEQGFVPFSVNGGSEATCFDGPSGGMGVHYVKGVDEQVELSQPEALVYELTPDGRQRLVAVEYVVPEAFVEDENGAVSALPEAMGRPFHKHASLPLYILHAWIWEPNPDGMFADFNPRVGSCPA